MSFFINTKTKTAVLTVAVAIFAIAYWKLNSVEERTSGSSDTSTNNNLPSIFISEDDKMASSGASIYDFDYTDIDGNPQSMAKYKDHVLIVVNVASKCGFTCVNYQQLTELYERYGESHGLRILAFPCNQFNSQEPLTEAEIKEFVKEYNVTYDMSSKINVNGDNAHPLWEFLKKEQKGILGTTSVKWNFTKFLVDKKGNVIKRYSPNTNPKEMEKDILNCFNN